MSNEKAENTIQDNGQATSENVKQESPKKTKDARTKKATSKKKAVDSDKKWQEKLDAEKDRYLRLFAEFENFKKRTSKERIEMFKTAGQDVIVSLLPVLDDFERALKEIKRQEDDVLFEGIQLIHNKFKDILQQKGLSVIEINTGDAFNADTHEAVTQIPAPSEDLKGKIIDVIEKGYSLGDKIIRFPKVVIGQ